MNSGILLLLFTVLGTSVKNSKCSYRWVARLRHRTSVLKVNIDARAHCQYSTTANVCFHMATGVGKFNNMRLYLALKRFVCEFDGWDRCFTRFLLTCTT